MVHKKSILGVFTWNLANYWLNPRWRTRWWPCLVTLRSSSSATPHIIIPHLVKKIKGFPLKAKSFWNREWGYFFRAKKNDTSNQIPQRCVSLAPKFPPFLALVGCSGLAMRVASQKFDAKEGEWFFALENLKQNLENLRAMVSYISNTMRKTVESRQSMQQQKWKTKGDVKLKLYSISELYLFLSMFRINYNFFTIVGRPGNNTSVPWKCLTIPSNTCNSPDSSKYHNNCVWSKESHILMVIQNPGTISKRFKKGSEVAIWNKLKRYCNTKMK